MEGSKKKNNKKKEHVEDAFELGKVLGEGNYAQVRLGKEKSTG
eukprot:COSAG01_NODE_5573_length_4168_cov_21.195583_4_plen_42_part_01